MRQILRKKEFLLDTFQYTLILYYQKETGVEDIAKKVGKKNAEVKKEMQGEWNLEAGALVICPDKVARGYMFISDDITVGMIQHEVIHIITDLFSKSNTEHNGHTDELYAYLCQYLFENIVKYLLTNLKIPIKSFLDL